LIHEEPEGATPLDDEELEGLKPSHITTRQELNEWEHTNIEQGEIWAFSRKRLEILTVGFVRELHFKMFDETWQWAGQWRKSGKNIGIPAYEISGQVKNLCEDVAIWVREEVYPLAETAARLHHRLVYIHPFPNGNGRHARLFADVLLYNNDQPRLPWGGVALEREGNVRDTYIAALKEADGGNFKPLLTYLGIPTKG
jgi:Fic-DOC domain mobile mystery protein B